MEHLLKEKGCKITPARLAILEIFSKTNLPLNAGGVCRKLSKVKGKRINEVTVYRTLFSFAEKGILQRVDLRKDSVYFELIRKHHHHIVCTSCETVEDFDNNEIEKVIEKAWGRIVGKSSKFKNIKEHSLELFGVCVKCLPE